MLLFLKRWQFFFFDRLALLANLRRLNWNAQTTQRSYISLYFLVPSLMTVCIALEEPAIVCLSLLATLNKWYPDVRNTSCDAPTRAALYVVYPWIILGSLNIDAVSQRLTVAWDIPHVTQHNLTIHGLDYHPWGSIATQLPNRDGFTNFQELRVYESAVEFCILMLCTMSSPLIEFESRPNEVLGSVFRGS